jgi:hypothetical protein
VKSSIYGRFETTTIISGVLVLVLTYSRVSTSKSSCTSFSMMRQLGP